MRYRFAILAVGVLAMCLPWGASNISAAQHSSFVGANRAEAGWDTSSRRRAAGYYAYRRHYRRTYGWYGAWRPYRRYVYRCRRFSYQCSYRPVRNFVSESIYSAYGHVGFRQGTVDTRGSEAIAAVGVPPARLGRYYVYPEMRDSRNVTKSGLLDKAIYAGQRVRLYEESGGFGRISSPGRSGRWVRLGAVIAE